MKRTISKMLGIAALAFAGLTGLVATPALATDGLPIIHTNAAGPYIGTWSCIPRTALPYPANGKFFFCGNPSTPSVPGTTFEGNYNSHRDGYVVRVQGTVPAYTQAALDAQNVPIYVFCTVKEAEIYFNMATIFPAGTDYRSVPSYFDPVNKRVVVLQYGIDHAAGQGCGTPTDTTGVDVTKKWPLWSRAYGAMTHEIGHFIDHFMDVPLGQYKHSDSPTPPAPQGIWRKYLMKDQDWINSTTRPGKFVPCVNIFNTSVDEYRDALNVKRPVCLGGALNADFTGFSNFQIMNAIIGMKYFLDTYAEAGGLTKREFFPEEFPYAINTDGTNSSSSASYKYFHGDYFLCSKRYVEIKAKYGREPNAGDLVSPYNRCVLP